MSFAINGNLHLTAVSVAIAGENIPMVLDSGSSVSLIDHEFYLSLKSCDMILEETQQPTLTLCTANGSTIEVTNEVLVPMTLAPDCNISIGFKVAKQLSTRLLAGVGTMTRMGAVLNFSRRSVYFDALHLNVPWCKPHPQPAVTYCLQITKHLSMPPRSATFIDVDHNLSPSSCPSNREAYVTKSTTSDLSQAFHLSPRIATLHDLRYHSTPFIVVDTSDKPLSLPPKTTVAHLEVLDETTVTISNFSDARDDVIHQSQHVAPPAHIPPTDTSTAMHSPVANLQEPTPPPLLSNW